MTVHGSSTIAVAWYARSFHTPIALCFLLLFEKVRRGLTTDLVVRVHGMYELEGVSTRARWSTVTYITNH